jgi:iduronate 2-sulfatase
MGYSLRTDQYRYIEWRDFGTGEVVDRELYDHSKSESEARNLAKSVSPNVLKELSIQLKSTHPPKKLEMRPAVHTSPSGAGRLQVEISFRNESETETVVYPITPAGRRNRGKRIASGEAASFNARIGGTYVVESRDGKIHEIHSPNWPPKLIVISSPKVNEESQVNP